MSARAGLQIDGKYLYEYGATLIDYIEPLTASPKDGGGLNLEGIDGIVPTGSAVMSAGTGSIEIMIEAQSEEFVLEAKRRFVNWVRQEDFRKYTIENNPGFYRWAKLLSESEPSITETASGCIGFFKFNLLFRDAYEYEVSPQIGFKAIENANAVTNLVDFIVTNNGSISDEFALQIENMTGVEPTLVDEGVYQLLLIPYTESNPSPLDADAVSQLTFGSHLTLEDPLDPRGYKWLVNMAVPNIFSSDGTVSGMKNYLAGYYSGNFFKIPSGRFILRVKRTLETPNAAVLPIEISYSFTSKYQ